MKQPNVEVKVNNQKENGVDIALLRLKKRIDNANILRDYRDHQFYIKPKTKRRERMKRAKFNEMLRHKREQND